MRRHAAAFLHLYLFTMAGIFLHELGHHLLGVPSLLSLSRNWPLVGLTPENRASAIIGTLAGPAVNLLLGYCGVFFYKRKAAGLSLGLANLFLTGAAAIINLVVDWLSHSWGNDLQQVSVTLGWNALILPAFFVAVTLPGFCYLCSAWRAEGKRWPLAIILVAWLLGGATLMMLDSILQIRFSIR